MLMFFFTRKNTNMNVPRLFFSSLTIQVEKKKRRRTDALGPRRDPARKQKYTLAKKTWTKTTKLVDPPLEELRAHAHANHVVFDVVRSSPYPPSVNRTDTCATAQLEPGGDERGSITNSTSAGALTRRWGGTRSTSQRRSSRRG